MTAIAEALYGSCAETGKLLSDYLDGELRGFRRFRVVRHLARCERCRTVLASLTRTVEQLRSLRSEEPGPDSVADAVVDRLKEESP